MKSGPKDIIPIGQVEVVKGSWSKLFSKDEAFRSWSGKDISDYIDWMFSNFRPSSTFVVRDHIRIEKNVYSYGALYNDSHNEPKDMEPATALFTNELVTPESFSTSAEPLVGSVRIRTSGIYTISLKAPSAHTGTGSTRRTGWIALYEYGLNDIAQLPVNAEPPIYENDNHLIEVADEVLHRYGGLSYKFENVHLSFGNRLEVRLGLDDTKEIEYENMILRIELEMPDDIDSLDGAPFYLDGVPIYAMNLQHQSGGGGSNPGGGEQEDELVVTAEAKTLQLGPNPPYHFTLSCSISGGTPPYTIVWEKYEDIGGITGDPLGLPEYIIQGANDQETVSGLLNDGPQMYAINVDVWDSASHHIRKTGYISAFK